MNPVLSAIHQRRATRAFEPVDIPDEIRNSLLEAATLAPSSFNLQPYRFYWVAAPENRRRVAEFCLKQQAAQTASALAVAVADVNSWRETAANQVVWMKQNGFGEARIADYVGRTKNWRWFFFQGWFSAFGAMKWLLLRCLGLLKILPTMPTSHRSLLAWATKGTALACENLMLAAESLGLNTCPMEGFDGRRLGNYLGISPRYQEVVMVIAIGKKAKSYEPERRCRRPIEMTVTIL